MNFSKKIMEFFFGKKFPIFNSKGQIFHQRKKAREAWKARHEKDPTKNWKNHSGLFYKKDN